MLMRTLIRIDEHKCNGCGACALACHEGAIAMVKGKARLLRDDYCDGLGSCLPACPTGAITFEKRLAAPYNAAAVAAGKAARNNPAAAAPPAETIPPADRASESLCACPGSRPMALPHTPVAANAPLPPTENGNTAGAAPNRLAQWPVQLQLAPVQALYYSGAHLLIAADCCAYAHAQFHAGFMAGRITLIGCPKLDAADYAKKLGEILRANPIQSLAVARMQVPCCGGLAAAATKALAQSGREIPLHLTTFATDGHIVSTESFGRQAL